MSSPFENMGGGVLGRVSPCERYQLNDRISHRGFSLLYISKECGTLLKNVYICGS